MMNTYIVDLSSPYDNNLTINSELEAAKALTDLAIQTNNTNSRPFWLSAKPYPTLSLSPPTLCSDSEDDVVVIEQDSIEESSWMARKRIQMKDKTGVQSNPSSSQTRVQHARAKIQDLNFAPEESVIEIEDDSEREHQTVMTRPRQAEKSTEIPKKPSRGKSAATGCKSRRDSNRLTEDQKQTRKLRRMLANRMSARKTILRRQARCEDLARQAAELEHENKNLKERKEVALKVYESLKTANDILKTRLKLTGVTMTDEVEQTTEGSKSAKTHAPASTTSNTPQFYLFHQTSSMSCVLPYMTAGATIVQPPPQNNIAVQSQNENLSRMNVQGNPSNALPFAWLCFPAHHANGAPPPLSLDLAGKHSQSGTSSVRKTLSDTMKDRRSPPKKMRGEASTSAGITRSAARADKAAGKRIVEEPPKVTYVATTVGSSRGSQVAAVGLSARQNVAIRRGRIAVASSTSATSSSSEDPEELNRREIRRQIMAYTAAAARRRRKEVVKTKNFQYSRHRIKIKSV